MTDASLKNLARLSQSLNEASDTLSKQIARIEAALNELKLGLTAWVVVSRAATESGDVYEESLGYGKSAGKWGLLYATEDNSDPESWSVVFLRDAPRATAATGARSVMGSSLRSPVVSCRASCSNRFAPSSARSGGS